MHESKSCVWKELLIHDRKNIFSINEARETAGVQIGVYIEMDRGRKKAVLYRERQRYNKQGNLSMDG